VIAGLVTGAESQEELAGRVLESIAALVGAHAVAIRNREGRVVGAWNVSPEQKTSPDLEVAAPGGSIAVWGPREAPADLPAIATFTGLALDRVRRYEAKANFVALAAHELRTPVAAIHGFVTTLHHLADRLDAERLAQVRASLVEQTQRMIVLIEQLLDLSRLDAEAIDIAPEPLHVRAQIEGIVASAGVDPAAVEIDVDEETVAVLDPNALERIVSNLVVNALRYGQPPVLVRAEQNDRHFRLTVEDQGGGVSPELVPALFERFTRSEGSRGSGGSGLGLAIARSYARAHGGDLLYEEASPRGALFKLVLPAQS
jgi:two-component system sensor histidine kinase MtrB